MGQQQLLLVILVTIIVGIATVVAINIFGDAADQANRDAVRQDLLAASAQAQGIWTKPELMGGANRDFGGDALSEPELLAALNIPTNSFTDNSASGEASTLTNDNGTYSIASATEFRLDILGSPASGGGDASNDIYSVVCRSTTGDWLVNINEGSAEAPNGCQT